MAGTRTSSFNVYVVILLDQVKGDISWKFCNCVPGTGGGGGGLFDPLLILYVCPLTKK